MGPKVRKIKYIKGYNKKYKISTSGIVWSKKKHGWKRLTIAKRKDGYVRVALYKNGKSRTRLLHQLVLETFVGPKPIGAVGRHFPDKDTTNNHLRNLHWGTPKENAEDRKVHGTEPDRKGERNGNSKLTKKDVKKIRRLHKTGNWTVVALAKKFSAGETTVRDIVKDRIWVGV